MEQGGSIAFGSGSRGKRMTSIFDILFGKGDRPIRRDVQLRITTDEDGNPKIEGVDGTGVRVSPEGSLDRVIITSDRFFHCGCSVEQAPGGRCGWPGCGRVSCQKHEGRCHDCSVPLCLEHSVFEDTQTGRLRLCHKCHDVGRRRRILGAGLRFLARPFVDFENGREK